jgi:predicted nucleic acid-binding protein
MIFIKHEKRQRTAESKNYLEKSESPLFEPDMRIASIALLNNLILITDNIKHF